MTSLCLALVLIFRKDLDDTELFVITGIIDVLSLFLLGPILFVLIGYW